MKGAFKEEDQNFKINIYNIKGWKHSRKLSFSFGEKRKSMFICRETDTELVCNIPNSM